MKKFQPLICSTYFFSCALPLNLDSYRECQFQCEYCFMKHRKIGVYDRQNTEPNIQWLKNKFKKIYDDKKVIKTNLIDCMLHNKIDLHFGTKSDPFQPQEREKHYTRSITRICNEYDQNIIFTTKSDNYYDVPLNPEKHSVQLSITNHYNDKFLEPHAPPFENRVKFYKQLKDEGFKVGIRFEPFIPNITDVKKCLEYFEEPDIVHIAKLNLLPQINHDKLIKYIGCNKKQFITHGKTHMKLDILYNNYLKEVFQYLEDNNYRWSARNSMFGTENCCCGDKLVHKSNTHDPVHLNRKYGGYWTLEQALKELEPYKECNCRNLYTSNRRGDLKTAYEYYEDRFYRKSTSKFTPEFQGVKKNEKTDLQTDLNQYL